MYVFVVTRENYTAPSLLEVGEIPRNAKYR
jgi:hypothetical protein